MRINNNMVAFNASRSLSLSNMNLGKSLEKLSSGYRFNRAGDDAADLVISQKLRAEVSGRRQATRNSQDGISFVRTAEGALSEVRDMLNRMRDLSVRATNDSNDVPARTGIRFEVDALAVEIDRIGISRAHQMFGQKLGPDHPKTQRARRLLQELSNQQAAASLGPGLVPNRRSLDPKGATNRLAATLTK